LFGTGAEFYPRGYVTPDPTVPHTNHSYWWYPPPASQQAVYSPAGNYHAAVAYQLGYAKYYPPQYLLLVQNYSGQWMLPSQQFID